MRFRLRDILLLMVLLAVYLTTAMYVMRATIQEDANYGMFIGVGVQVATFAILFPALLLLVQRYAERKVRPVVLRLSTTIPWRSMFVSLGFTVLIGIGASYAGHPVGLAAFVGASMPLLAHSTLAFVLNHAAIGAAGVVYFTKFQPWREVEVVQSADGNIEALYPFPMPPQAKKVRVLRWTVPRPLLEVPPKDQQQVTELYEQGVLTNHESDE